MARLSARQIGETALALLDEQGLDGFTIRAVAQALDVTPMALYHHVDSKAALAALVVEIASEGIPFGDEELPWRDELYIIFKWSHDKEREHPGLSQLQRVYSAWTPAIVKWADRWMKCWDRSGLSPEGAFLAATTSSAAIRGLVAASGLSSERAMPEMPDVNQFHRGVFLLTGAVDVDAMFEIGVRGVIEGVHARLMQAEQGKTKAP